MTENDIPDYNIFMMCEQLNKTALTTLNKDYKIRNCRADELHVWKEFPFDSPEQAVEYDAFMVQYFTDTYQNYQDQFFKNTLFVCDQNDTPVATCSTWKAYDKFHTIQWFKTQKNHEGKGLGRALFSIIMQNYSKDDYPIFLHTQPGSFRAIKLYSDFGFSLLSNDRIGSRSNDLEKCLPILKTFMPISDFENLIIKTAPAYFIEALAEETSIQF